MTVAQAGRAALLVLLVLGVVGWAVSGTEYFLRLAYLAVFLLAGSAFWAHRAIRGIRLQRTARLLRATVGEAIEERFEIVNAGHWPCLWLEIRNQSNLPAAGGSRLLTNLGPRRRRFYTARHLLTERGAYPLGPTLLISGDLFGLYRVHRLVPASETLLALPMLFDLPLFTLPAGPLPGSRVIRLKTSEVTPHAAGLREYQPGDPLKRVHWPATARYRRFMAKEFEQESEAVVWIFLDAQSLVQAGRPSPPIPWNERLWPQKRVPLSLTETTLEYAVCTAASLARRLIHQRYPIGLACSTARPILLPPERGDRQLIRILETLALVKADGELPFESLLLRQGRLLAAGTYLILITPGTQSSLLPAVEYLQERRLHVLAVFLDAQSFGGPASNLSLANALRRRGVAVCTLACGDNLDQKLRWETVALTTSEDWPTRPPAV